MVLSSAARLASLVALLVLLSASVSAAAVTPKPVPSCAGLAFSDDVGDQDATNVPADFWTPSTDLTGGFLLFDEATGKTTFNIVVDDLALTVPTGYTSLGWIAYFTTPDGSAYFARAILDATGSIVYEYGGPDKTLPVTRNAYQGDTSGTMFTGKDGVVQIVLPTSLVPAGTKIDGLYAETFQGNNAPNAVPPLVTRGVYYAGDTGDEGASFAAQPCPPV